MQAVCQVVFTDVLIVCRLDVTDAASDWLLIEQPWNGMKGLPGVQLQNLCPVALHTAPNKFMSIFQRALILRAV